MFRKAKVGNRVWDLMEGWGTIVEINPNSNYPIKVRTDRNYLGLMNDYTFTGFYKNSDITPRLFWDIAEVKIPKKPLSIYDILKAIKPIEFKSGERNLFLLWGDYKDGLIMSSQHICQTIGVLYFEKSDIDTIMDFVRNKKVSKEEFFKAYNEVFYKE